MQTQIPDRAIDWIARYYKRITYGDTPASRANRFEQWADKYWIKFGRNLDVDFRALSLNLPY